MRDLHEENIRALSSALIETVQVRNDCEMMRDAHRVTIINTTQFALLWNFDLSCLLFEIGEAHSASDGGTNWKRTLKARLLALTIVECCEDFSVLLGKPLRSAIKALQIDSQLVAELNGLGRSLNIFRQAHDEGLRLLRNTVVAHRDHDASKQIQALRNIDVEKIESLGWEILSWTTQLHRWVTRVIQSAPIGGIE